MWRNVIDPMTGHYVAGFSRGVEYEFMRPEWKQPARFKLDDQSDFFNLAGLKFRSL